MIKVVEYADDTLKISIDVRLGMKFPGIGKCGNEMNNGDQECTDF